MAVAVNLGIVEPVLATEHLIPGDISLDCVDKTIVPVDHDARVRKVPKENLIADAGALTVVSTATTPRVSCHVVVGRVATASGEVLTAIRFICKEVRIPDVGIYLTR